LGQGKDYVYHGSTEFRGIHNNDILQLSNAQRKQFKLPEISNIFPEYYVLRVDEFDKVAENSLDEWIEFLKTGDISDNAKAQGLPEARERLKRDKMSKSEQQEYNSHIEALRYQRSVIETNMFLGKEEGYKEGVEVGIKEGLKEGIKEGIEKGIIEGLKEGIEKGIEQGIEKGETQKALQIAQQLMQMKLNIADIIKATGLTEDEINKLK
jgi:flagellar biosynthesis/type III secretory pathway protein FliH